MHILRCRSRLLVVTVLIAFTLPLFSQQGSSSTSDPLALTIAARALGTITGGSSINDVTFNGNGTWDQEPATISLKALGFGESRLDVTMANGTRTDIRDAQTGLPLGEWVAPDGSSGKYARHNCYTDAVWFFPPLGSLVSSNVILAYVGEELYEGTPVQHLRAYSSAVPLGVPGVQQLGTMDFYLDSKSFLPVATTFNVHPDNDLNKNLLVEVRFEDYQSMENVLVPQHIRLYQERALMLDLTVTSASFNTGLPLSMFAAN